VLLGNPHYPWDGVNRFDRTHFIIPGDINIVGVSYIGMPMIRIGHTETLAWSNTVSTARRSGYYELQLNPQDPTQYKYDGQWLPMTKDSVSVEVMRDGKVARRRRARCMRHAGARSSRARASRGRRRRRMHCAPSRSGCAIPISTVAVWRSKTVRDMKASLAKWQSFRFNATAVDSTGEALYGDMGMIPNVSQALVDKCAASDFAKKQWKETRFAVLDGSRAECDWATDKDSSAPGVAGRRRGHTSSVPTMSCRAMTATG